MNLQRNPSILGAELSPRLRGSPDLPASVQDHGRPMASLESPISSLGVPQKVRTLRRVQRLALGRRISFSTLAAPGEDADCEAEDEDESARSLRRERQRQRELGQLGSAFQLQ